MHKKILVLVDIAAALFIVALLARPVLSPQAEKTDQPAPTEVKTSSEQAPAFNMQKYSLTDPKSPWIIVNKQNGIPTSYIPDDLIVPDVRLRLGAGSEQMQFSESAEKNLRDMFAAAAKDGVSLVFGSGYRSATLQRQFYASYVAQDGQKAADTYSARPGHSEHQTGLAVDITSPSGTCHLEICWEDTPEGKWIAKNSYKHGFTIRYQEGKDKITGYQYEPWHVRYVGKDLAAEVKNSTTLEEFFDLPPAPDY